jgi:hypothetical protein
MALVSYKDISIKYILTNTKVYSNSSILKNYKASNPNTISDTNNKQVPKIQKCK